MKFRLAANEDLPELKKFFGRITDNLNSKGIYIWDEIYPYCALVDDIGRESLYIFEENGKFVSVFALCPPQEDEGSVVWEKPEAKAIYIYRLGVSPEYLKKGIGSFTIKEAERVSSERGAEYLRLLVVDFNEPAINFYLKNGYKKADGYYLNFLNDKVLKEYGYEIKL